MADSTVAAIQAINASVGLHAPTAYPVQATAADFPLAVTFVGPMEGKKFGVTTYITLVMLADPQLGVDASQVFDQGNALLKAMRAEYRTHANIDGHAIAAGGHPALRTGFGSPYGMVNMVKFAGKELYGFEWHVSLMEP